MIGLLTKSSSTRYYNYNVIKEQQGKCIPDCPTLTKALEDFAALARLGITQVHP